ncbi:hypothetical protein C8T65DRAFT_698468 [Cerioporus squamosus]|nr:hypothetical protein C8T65DRAFT_698468 [Cerioporus squamosus]
MATGRNTPSNKDRWYQMCSNKLHGSPLHCNFFKWRDIGPNPIKRGKLPAGTASKRCKGYVCTHGRGSRVVNAECLFGLCQTCCVHLHVTITGTPLCSCKKHENALGEGRTLFHLPDDAILPTITYPPYWQPPSPSSAPASLQPEPDDPGDAPSPPRPRRTQGSAAGRARGGRGGVTAGRRAAPAPAAVQSESTAPSACQGSNHRSTYAISFSPVYDYTLYQAQMIEQQRLDQAAMSKQVGHPQMRMTDVFWWDENGKPAREIRVQIPNDPWFHPRDSTYLVNRFSLKDGALFQFYDWRKDTWIDGGLDSVPLHVDLSGELHYRSQGVTWSPDMPGASMPCPLPASATSLTPASAAPLPSTPSSRALGKQPSSGPVIDLTDEDDAASSVTPTAASFLLHRSHVTSTPSSSSRDSATPSSRFSTPSSVGAWSTPSQRADFDYGTPSFLNDDWSGLAISDAVPAASSSSVIPAASPSAVTPTRSSSPIMKSRSASSSTLTLSDGGLDLEPAPRGPTATGWPWMYACDMIAGFKALEALRRTGLKNSAAFPNAFRGHKYIRGTFNENLAVYKAAQEVPGELEHWRELGRQDSVPPRSKSSRTPFGALNLSMASSLHTTPRGRTVLTHTQLQSLEKHELLNLLKTGNYTKGKAAALHFRSEDELRRQLTAGGKFTEGPAFNSRDTFGHGMQSYSSLGSSKNSLVRSQPVHSIRRSTKSTSPAVDNKETRGEASAVNAEVRPPSLSASLVAPTVDWFSRFPQPTRGHSVSPRHDSEMPAPGARVLRAGHRLRALQAGSPLPSGKSISHTSSLPRLPKPTRGHSVAPAQYSGGSTAAAPVLRAGSEPAVLMGPTLDVHRLRALPGASVAPEEPTCDTSPTEVLRAPPPDIPRTAPDNSTSVVGMQIDDDTAPSQITSTSGLSTPSPSERVGHSQVQHVREDVGAASGHAAQNPHVPEATVPAMTGVEAPVRRSLLSQPGRVRLFGMPPSPAVTMAASSASAQAPAPEAIVPGVSPLGASSSVVTACALEQDVKLEENRSPPSSDSRPTARSFFPPSPDPAVLELEGFLAGASPALIRETPDSERSRSANDGVGELGELFAGARDGPHDVFEAAVDKPATVFEVLPDEPMEGFEVLPEEPMEGFEAVPDAPKPTGGFEAAWNNLADVFEAAPAFSVREHGDSEGSGSERSYCSDDADSDDARDDPEEPGLALICETLEAYGFVDWRYEPSDRDSSPPSTPPHYHASSEAETDYSCGDLSINRNTGKKTYRRFLNAARKRKAEATERLTGLDDSEVGQWPEALKWRGSGKIAAFGEDRTVPGCSSQIVDVLCDVPIFFDRRHGLFSVSSAHLVGHLIQSVTVENVCGYLGVPVKVGGKISTCRLAFWDQPGGKLKSLHREVHIELSVLDPAKSARDYRDVRLGVQYVVEPYVQIPSPPTKSAHAVVPSLAQHTRQRVQLPPPVQEPDTDGARAHTPLSSVPDDEDAYTSEDKARAMQLWLHSRFGKLPLYRAIVGATRQKSEHAATLLEWVRFAKEVKDAGPADNSAHTAARGQYVSRTALGIFLGRGHDWVKDALDAQQIIEARIPAVGQLTSMLVTKGVMLGARTLRKACEAARDGKPLQLPRRGRGKTGHAEDTEESSDGGPRHSHTPVCKDKPKPRPRPMKKARTEHPHES